MKEATQGSRWKSSDVWETLEQMVRGRVQEFIQAEPVNDCETLCESG